MTIGKRIKMTREERKLSQGELGKIIHMHPRLISKYETDMIKPTIDNLKKLATALQVTTDYLIFDGERKEKMKFIDPELKEQFSLLNEMDKKDREIIKSLIEAYIAKNQIKGIVTRR